MTKYKLIKLIYNCTETAMKLIIMQSDIEKLIISTEQLLKFQHPAKSGYGSTFKQ